MATKMFDVQQKIFLALGNSIELKNKVQGIYDYVPENTVCPYITFGEIISNSDNTKTENGEKLTFILDIWSESKGRKQAVSILTLVEEILETEISLISATILEQKVTNRSVTEESYGLYHATIEIEFLLEWED